MYLLCCCIFPWYIIPFWLDSFHVLAAINFISHKKAPKQFLLLHCFIPSSFREAQTTEMSTSSSRYGVRNKFCTAKHSLASLPLDHFSSRQDSSIESVGLMISDISCPTEFSITLAVHISTNRTPKKVWATSHLLPLEVLGISKAELKKMCLYSAKSPV